ncbi:NADH-quinone oxidoreductase subunit NuoE [Blastococcus sp. Marseille-P5729]|uniref:NADH-quinone oxidoreductase subunit NuoE n=1 Tax=Blastococcus sp. Marseille-P5729 TaxID=2086582 RepID=UPI000D1070B0|nr:NADH-quinone oxidoreductase subunit NuoE [Blastococcus sp. Marseille-P5729]
MPLDENTRALAQQIIDQYPQSRSALLPMLHLVQAEEGYVSPDGIAFCADALGLTKAEVGAVATFYTMYKRHPTGEHLVSVCTNTLCGMLGGDAIYAALKDELGVGHDETTADGTLTLEHAECLAACDYAPVVTVNYEFFDNQTVESAMSLVAALREGERPQPTRGGKITSFRDAELELAGLLDPELEAQKVAAVDSIEPSLRGLKLARDRGEAAPEADYDSVIPPVPAKEEKK